MMIFGFMSYLKTVSKYRRDDLRIVRLLSIKVKMLLGSGTKISNMCAHNRLIKVKGRINNFYIIIMLYILSVDNLKGLLFYGKLKRTNYHINI